MLNEPCESTPTASDPISHIFSSPILEFKAIRISKKIILTNAVARLDQWGKTWKSYWEFDELWKLIDVSFSCPHEGNTELYTYPQNYVYVPHVWNYFSKYDLNASSVGKNAWSYKCNYVILLPLSPRYENHFKIYNTLYSM